MTENTVLPNQNKSITQNTIKLIIESGTVILMSITMVIIAFCIFFVSFDDISKLIVGSEEFNIWNLLYTVVEFMLGIAIIGTSVTMATIKFNANEKIDKSIKYIEVFKVFATLTIIFVIFFMVSSIIIDITDNLYYYKIAKAEGNISSQENCIYNIIFEIFMVCIVTALMILIILNIINFIKSIKTSYESGSLKIKGVTFTAVMSIILAVLSGFFAFMGFPFFIEIYFIDSSLDYVAYCAICYSLLVFFIALSVYMFSVSSLCKKTENSIKSMNSNINNQYAYQNNGYFPQNGYINNGFYNTAPNQFIPQPQIPQQNNINQSQNIICPVCGNNCNFTAKFCNACGNKL